MFARSHRVSMIVLAGVVTSAFALTACGESGSSGTSAPPSAASGAGCAPIASEDLVLLADDKKLQDSDNIVAVANGKVATPAMMTAVDKVAAALNQPKLLALNKAVEVDRKTPPVQGVRRREQPGHRTVGRQRERHHWRGQLPGEPGAGRALQDRSDGGRFHRHGAAVHQP